MAVETPLRIVTQRIGDAIRSFVAGEGLDRDEVAIVGTLDEPTERIYLVVGSYRKIDERRWHSGIMNAIRKEFPDAPGLTSRLVLVVRNVSRIEQVYREMIVGDDEVDITEML